jgi:hypothetical protein
VGSFWVFAAIFFLAGTAPALSAAGSAVSASVSAVAVNGFFGVENFGR